MDDGGRPDRLAAVTRVPLAQRRAAIPARRWRAAERDYFGVDPDPPRDEQGACTVDRSLSRRTLVQGIAAGTAASAIGGRALAQEATPAPAAAKPVNVSSTSTG